jgi:hypothetical protein
MPGIMKEGNIFTIGASFFSRLRCFALADRSIADCRCLYLTEPMINMGASSLIHWKDDWTATTRDGKRSAQFEETILFVPFFLPLLMLSCTSADLLLPLCLTQNHRYRRRHPHRPQDAQEEEVTTILSSRIERKL